MTTARESRRRTTGSGSRLPLMLTRARERIIPDRAVGERPQLPTGPRRLRGGAKQAQSMAMKSFIGLSSVRSHRPWGSPTCSSRPCSPLPGNHPARTTSRWPSCSGSSACVSRSYRGDIAGLGTQHGHRVLRVSGKGTKIVLLPLPPAVGWAIDQAIGSRTRD